MYVFLCAYSKHAFLYESVNVSFAGACTQLHTHVHYVALLIFPYLPCFTLHYVMLPYFTCRNISIYDHTHTRFSGCLLVQHSFACKHASGKSQWDAKVAGQELPLPPS